MNPNRTIQIQEPIWSEKAIGIALEQHDKLEHVIEIEILYVSKKPPYARIYPDKYHMTVGQIIEAQKRVDRIKGNDIFVVPISRLIYAPKENG